MFEDSGLTRLSDFSGEEHLIDDGVDFVEVEDKIELADVVEILVENFDEIVDGFQMSEIVVSNVGAQAKIKPRVASIDDLEVAEFDEVGVFGVSDGDDGVYFLDQFLLLFILVVFEPFGQTSFTSTILNQDESDHFPCFLSKNVFIVVVVHSCVQLHE